MVAPARTDIIFSGIPERLSCLHRRRYDPPPAEGHDEGRVVHQHVRQVRSALQTLWECWLLGFGSMACHLGDGL